jgi:hypothetical protein
MPNGAETGELNLGTASKPRNQKISQENPWKSENLVVGIYDLVEVA